MLKLVGQKLPGPPRRYRPPLKDSPPKISKKFSCQKIYDFKIFQPPQKSGGCHVKARLCIPDKVKYMNAKVFSTD